MTPEEIRNIPIRANTDAHSRPYNEELFKLKMLKEIAAQLAELNQNIKESNINKHFEDCSYLLNEIRNQR